MIWFWIILIIGLVAAGGLYIYALVLLNQKDLAADHPLVWPKPKQNGEE